MIFSFKYLIFKVNRKYFIRIYFLCYGKVIYVFLVMCFSIKMGICMVDFIIVVLYVDDYIYLYYY